MSTAAIIKTSHADIRVEPSQRSELFSQLLLGDRVAILEEKENWLHCRMFDQNTGWIHRGYIIALDEGTHEPSDSHIVCVDALASQIYVEPDVRSMPQCIVLSGTRLTIESLVRHWYSVRLPDGSCGYIAEKVCRPAISMPTYSAEALVRCAMRFCGVPYFWGGTTAAGLDCSGMVQLSARVLGKIVPRNASQQAEALPPVEGLSDPLEASSGDLLFFAENEKVDHVGIALGDGHILHAALSNGQVRIESMHQVHPGRKKQLAEMFYSAGRIIED